MLLTILYWSPALDDPSLSAAIQNFLITIEMLFAAILLRFAFPYKPYMELRKDGQGRGVPVKKVADNFRDTLNPGECECVCTCVCVCACTCVCMCVCVCDIFPAQSLYSLSLSPSSLIIMSR